MLKQSWVPLDLLPKMKTNLCNAIKKLTLNLVSWMLYEVFSFLICFGVVKDKRLSCKFNKFTHHQRLIRYSIKRRTNWEMRRTLVSAPEITPTYYDCSAFLVGAVLIFYLYRKRKSELQDDSIDKNGIFANSKDDITRIFLLLRLAMSMELYNMWHEASVEEVRENHNVMVFKELLMAGDVEINPGPYPPELLARLITDFAELRPKYDLLGVQLKVPVYIIEEIKSDTGDRLVKIFDHWLHNTQEDLWFEQLGTALQRMHRRDLADIAQEKYMKKFSEVPAIQPDSQTRDLVASPSTSIQPTDDIVVDSQKDVCILSFHALDSKDNQHKHELKKETNRMISLFTDITDGLYKFITDQKKLKQLKYLIQTWVKYGTIEEDDPYKDVTKKMIRAINDDDELLAIFSSYYSFFNFKLVERAIDIMNYEVGKDRMKIYKQDFMCYLKRRVTQCPSGIGMKGEDHVTLLVELDYAFADCRIEHLLQLGDDICNIMNFKDYKLHIEGVNKGCICVAFHLHKSEIPQGFFLLHQQIELLQKLRYMSAKILKVKCNGDCYLINEETSDFGEKIQHAQLSLWEACHTGRQFEVGAMLKVPDIDVNLPSVIDGKTPLMLAAENGSLEVVSILLKNKASPNSTEEKSGKSALFYAAENEHIEVVKKLLVERANILLTDKSGASILDIIPEPSELNDYIQEVTKIHLHLFEACETGDLGKVHSLVKNEVVNIDAVRSDGKTPLMCAAQHGYAEIIECLVTEEAMALCEDKEGNIAVDMIKGSPKALKCLGEETLNAAAAKGNITILQRMLDLKIDPNAKQMDDYSYTPLLWACERGRHEALKILLQSGADPNAESASSWTGLLVACRYDHKNLVKTLLERDINVNKQTNTGWTALMLAAANGSKHLVELLLKRGADPLLKDKNGFTPLCQAAQDGHYEVVELLVKGGYYRDVDECKTVHPEDWTPVMLATKNGHADVVKFLVDHGADIDRQKADGTTVLHIAAYRGHTDLVRYFCLTKDANVDVQDQDGITPLMYASKTGELEVVKILLQKFAKIDIEENDIHWTAPHFAIQGKHQDVVNYFLEYHIDQPDGINLDHKDIKENTIIDLAQQINQEAYQSFQRIHPQTFEKHKLGLIERARIIQKTPTNYFSSVVDKFEGKVNSEKLGAAAA